LIAIDTNLIIYALVSSQPEHPRAKKWILDNRVPLVTTNTNVAEALRLLTHPRIFKMPLALRVAVDLLDTFLKEFDVSVLEDAQEWWNSLPHLLQNHPGLKGNEIFDAHIALCLKFHGIKQICTLDGDFSKLSFVKQIKF